MGDAAVRTLLFTDLVGSTALSASMSAAEADTLRRAHLALLREPVAALGGDEVKNLGDGLMVAFASPSRALACAVAMQRAVDRYNRRADPPLAVRIGVSGGEVSEEEGDYFGDPVVEAARLCAAAQGGQILVAATVRAMAGRNAPALVEVGGLELKGLPEPLATLELDWREAAVEEARSPLPPRLAAPTGGGLFPFAGRRAELGVLADACKRASAGSFEVVLVAGEPGVGKTTLVSEVARSAYAAGAAVSFGGCQEGLGAPYQPWITALSHLLRHTERGVLDGLRPVHASALVALMPAASQWLATHEGDAGGEPERYVVMDAVAALLERLSAEDEVVLVLDDLQWSDVGTIDLLRHLLASPTSARVAVLGTYRSSDLGRDAPLATALPDLRRHPAVNRLSLDGLDDLETIELLESAAGFELPPEGVALAHALRQETGGNPLFTVELLRHLAESGALQLQDDGTYSLVGGMESLELPSSIREVVSHRVRRLGQEVERVLSLGSVIGVEFDLETLALVAQLDEDSVLELLDLAVAAGIVTEASDRAGQYRFVHALLAHTLAQDLGPTRRQRTHQRVAEALEGLDAVNTGRVAELAHHWLAATRPADAERAVHAALLAGEAALAAFAPTDAVSWYERALEVMDRQSSADPMTRARVLVGLARAQLEAGQPAHRDTLRDAGRIARQLGDRDLLVEISLCRLPGFEDVSLSDPDRHAVIEAALDATGDDDLYLRAKLLLALAEDTDRREDRRRDLTDQAVATAWRIEDAGRRCEVLAETGFLFSRPDTVPQRLEAAAEVLRLAPRTARWVRFQARATQRNAALEAADRSLADEALAEMQAIATEMGTPYARWQALTAGAFHATVDGRLEEAEALATEAYAIGSSIGNTAADSSFGAQLMAIRQQQGRLGELVDLISQTIEDYETIPGWDSALAVIYGEVGRFDEQRALVAAARAVDFSNTLFDLTYANTLAGWADCAADVGDVASAEILVDRLLPWAEQLSVPSVYTLGATARPLGRSEALVGRDDAGERHLRLSVAMHEQVGSPYWLARSQIDLASFLRSRGRGDEAVTVLDAARTTADRLGLHGLRHHLARASGSAAPGD